MNDVLNDAVNRTAGVGGLVTAILIGKVNDEPVNWGFPVVAGTPRDLVQAAIRERCVGHYSVLLSDPGTSIQLTNNPWTGALTADNPPIGLRPPVPPGGDPPPQAPPPGRTADGRRIVPPQGTAGTAPPRPALDLGPLPEDAPRPVSGEAVLADLEAVLADWRVRYRVTSAEFFFYLGRVIAAQARRLAVLERPR